MLFHRRITALITISVLVGCASDGAISGDIDQTLPPIVTVLRDQNASVPSSTSESPTTIPAARSTTVGATTTTSGLPATTIAGDVVLVVAAPAPAAEETVPVAPPPESTEPPTTPPEPPTTPPSPPATPAPSPPSSPSPPPSPPATPAPSPPPVTLPKPTGLPFATDPEQVHVPGLISRSDVTSIVTLAGPGTITMTTNAYRHDPVQRVLMVALLGGEYTIAARCRPTVLPTDWTVEVDDVVIATTRNMKCE